MALLKNFATFFILPYSLRTARDLGHHDQRRADAALHHAPMFLLLTK
jgi:hypothetical protein